MWVIFIIILLPQVHNTEYLSIFSNTYGKLIVRLVQPLQNLLSQGTYIPLWWNMMNFLAAWATYVLFTAQLKVSLRFHFLITKACIHYHAIYEGRTESHKQLFFACEVRTADEGELGCRWNQLLCYPWVSCDVNSLHHVTNIAPNKMATNDMLFRQRAVIEFLVKEEILAAEIH